MAWCARAVSVPRYPRCELSKPTESKAGPLSKDIKAIVLVNVVAVLSLALFAAMGMAIASIATGVPLI